MCKKFICPYCEDTELEEYMGFYACDYCFNTYTHDQLLKGGEDGE